MNDQSKLDQESGRELDRLHKVRVKIIKNWLRAQRNYGPVTADELITRIKKNWPQLTHAEIDALYQEVG